MAMIKVRTPALIGLFCMMMVVSLVPHTAHATTWSAVVDDNFNRANTSTGTASSTTGVGNNWMDTFGGMWNISSDELQGTSNSSSDYLTKFLLRPSSENATNSRIVATIPANENFNGQFLGLVLRWQASTDNYYLAHIGTSGVFLYKIVAGNTTLITSTPVTLNTTHSYSVDFSATSTSSTNLSVIATDLTTSTVAGTINVTDNEPTLQTSGSIGLTTWYNSGVHAIHATRVQTFGTSAPDVTPPVISAIASTTNQTTATITWTTNENATSTVFYGTTSSYGTASTSTSLVTSHSITLTGLATSTVYHYQISTADASNNVATSSDLTFTTGSAPSIDPVGYWPLDENASTSNAVDAIATNTGFQTGMPDISTDVPSVSFIDTGSRVFNGSNYFTINRPVQDNFTICAWIKTTSTGGGTNHWQSAPIMDSEVSGLANDFGFGIGNGGKLMYGNGGSFDSQVNGATTINDNTWHNVCATRNGTTGAVKLYVDAQLDGSGTTSTGTLSSNPNARIGYGYDGAAHYVGLIDDLRAYSTDLSQTQLLSIYQGNNDASTQPNTTPPSISNIVASSTSSGATITWSTNEAASTKLAYSSDANYASSTSQTDTVPRVTSHTASLTGLLSCTLYNFKLTSGDALGNYATSGANSFITAGCSGGVIPSSATSTSVTVSGAATSTVTDTGRTFTVATPANFTATSSSVVIQIKGLNSSTVLGSIGKPSSSLSSAASIAFDVTALVNNTTVLDSFNSPVTISYTYTDADVSGLDENSLTMYHYHDGAWLPLNNCSVNTSSNTITCSAPSFSTFAIFGTPLATTNNSSNSSGGGGGLPWCSGPSAPGWNTSLLGGGCAGKTSLTLATNTPTVTPVATTTSMCPYYHFTRQLKIGDKGEDVHALQKFLNCAGFLLGSSGPGSPGNETTTFSDRTLKAVKTYQQTYSGDILTPIKTITPTGIFAGFSQKKAYSLMISQ